MVNTICNRLKKEERFSDEYVAFIHEILSKLSTPISQFDIISDFVNYYGYYNFVLPVRIFKSEYNALYEQYRRGCISLSKKDLDAISDAEYAYSLEYYLKIIKKTDSLEIERKMAPYSKSIRRVDKLIKKHATVEWIKNPDAIKEYAICREIKSIKDFLNEQPLETSAHAYVMTALLCEFLYDTQIPFSDDAVLYAMDCIGVPKLQNLFVNRNNHYRRIAEKNVNEEFIRNRANEVAGIMNADTLVMKLL